MRWYVFASKMGASSVRRSSGVSPVTVPRVPTGMKTGVSMVPLDVKSVPRRALEPGSLAPATKRKWEPTGAVVERAFVGPGGRLLTAGRLYTRRGGAGGRRRSGIDDSIRPPVPATS